MYDTGKGEKSSCRNIETGDAKTLETFMIGVRIEQETVYIYCKIPHLVL
jgi:hypothetical protein